MRALLNFIRSHFVRYARTAEIHTSYLHGMRALLNFILVTLDGMYALPNFILVTLDGMRALLNFIHSYCVRYARTAELLHLMQTSQ